MAHGDVTTNIPAELKSVAMGGIVASADGIFDYNENKTQEELNQEFKENSGYVKPVGGIPKADLSQELINEINSFITNTVNNLVNYYTKDESYTKNEIISLLNAIKQFTYEYVNTLPEPSSSTTNKIYLVPSENSDENNIKDEYITILDNSSYRWEPIGNTNIDLSGYLKTTDIAAWAKAPNKPTYTSEEIGAYSKPSSGIPKTDLASAVQSSLNKADNAQEKITTVTVNVDNNTGTPSGSASVSGGTLTINFSNLKGSKGDTGATGPAGADGATGAKGDKGDKGEDGRITEINHGTNDTTFTLTPNVRHVWGEVTALNLTLAAGDSGYSNEYLFRFFSGSTPTVLTLPQTIQWVQPLTCQQDKYYEVSIVNNLAAYITSGMVAAESSGGTPEYATKDWVTNKIETEIDGGYYYE